MLPVVGFYQAGSSCRWLPPCLQVQLQLLPLGGLHLAVEAAPRWLPACRRVLQALLGSRHVQLRPTGRFLRGANALVFEGGGSGDDRVGLLPYTGHVHPEHTVHVPHAVHRLALLAPAGALQAAHGALAITIAWSSLAVEA